MARKRVEDYEELREERKYGFFWYSGLWSVLRVVLIALASLTLVFGLISVVYGKVNDAYLSAVDPADETPIAFSIKSGQSLTRVANNLEEQGLIKNRSIFKYYVDFRGMGQKIQAGEYTLTKSMDIFAIADQLTSGDGRPLTANITLIPGWTVEDIALYLKEQGVLSDESAFLTACQSGADYSDYYFVQEELATQGVQNRKYVLEGYLSPNTYEVYTDTSVSGLIKKLLDQTDKVFSYEWQQRASELGLSMDQTLTLASLIEKEAKTADFKRVSAVFHNRLKQNMKLGSDVTIHYITDERRMSLRDSDLAIDSPYNTYLYAGLPLGPICNPSAAAIEAALYPDESYLADGYLYFCSKDPDTGELYFSKTLAEHEQAVAIYAPLWKQYDQERGIQ